MSWTTCPTLLLLAIATLAHSAATPVQPFDHHHDTKPNRLAGTWSLRSLTFSYPNGTTTDLAGPSPYGLLIFTPGLHYSVEINRADFSSIPADPSTALLQPGTPEYNAAVVAGVIATAGTYAVDERGEYAGLKTLGANIPAVIGVQRGPGNQSFEISKHGDSMVEMIFQGDGSQLRNHWERVE